MTRLLTKRLMRSDIDPEQNLCHKLEVPVYHEAVPWPLIPQIQPGVVIRLKLYNLKALHVLIMLFSIKAKYGFGRKTKVWGFFLNFFVSFRLHGGYWTTVKAAVHIPTWATAVCQFVPVCVWHCTCEFSLNSVKQLKVSLCEDVVHMCYGYLCVCFSSSSLCYFTASHRKWHIHGKDREKQNPFSFSFFLSQFYRLITKNMKYVIVYIIQWPAGVHRWISLGSTNSTLQR